ncbi:MAG TPA: hypothetical protein PK890_01905 [Terrimesophilobacter sp.]|nr:hypothetical protein [Terrimesophilobacter sp.]
MKARLLASVVLAATVALVTSACTFLTPQATLDKYDPSDGTSVTVGDVLVQNAILLSADGETASLLASITNRGSSSATVKLQYEDASGAKIDESIHVNANSTKNLGDGSGETLILENLDAPLGSLLDIYVQIGNETGAQFGVPVLDGSLAEYRGLLP